MNGQEFDIDQKSQRKAENMTESGMMNVINRSHPAVYHLKALCNSY
jgi:hypothetical protein